MDIFPNALWFYETTFQSNGELKRLNMRFWDLENPHWMQDVDNPLDPRYLVRYYTSADLTSMDYYLWEAKKLGLCIKIHDSRGHDATNRGCFSINKWKRCLKGCRKF
ncbi:hypothetical protein J6590_095460 [Homalodisca vitripennis]|nr:hypothetical protein J6590_078621 [Homalodisca vitripennis]KAG8255327.1 hypothetical protein J6590_095460 [Homalodisca vitripennis]